MHTGSRVPVPWRCTGSIPLYPGISTETRVPGTGTYPVHGYRRRVSGTHMRDMHIFCRRVSGTHMRDMHTIVWICIPGTRVPFITICYENLSVFANCRGKRCNTIVCIQNCTCRYNFDGKIVLDTYVPYPGSDWKLRISSGNHGQSQTILYNCIHTIVCICVAYPGMHMLTVDKESQQYAYAYWYKCM